MDNTIREQIKWQVDMLQDDIDEIITDILVDVAPVKNDEEAAEINNYIVELLIKKVDGFKIIGD